MKLDPAASAAGFRLIAREALTSTNTEAIALARRGDRGPLWITAQQQSAGRGRRGAQWVSEPGNLYATLLLHDPASADRAPELSFVTSLVLYDAIGDCAPALRAGLALKWPNDVLCSGKKLAGILIEGERLEASLAVAIGIGVNCASHPPRAAYPATDLAAAGTVVSAAALFHAISGAMLRRLAQWRRGEGFASIRADWLARAAGIGGEMRVQLPDRVYLGRGEGLDQAGHLMLRLADGSVRTIAAGDVFPLTESGG